MSHFRVENTKFRILKGGKIGLSFSIALIGSIINSPMNLYSQTFFDATVSDGTTYTSGDISATQKTDDSIGSTANYNSTNEDIIFSPIRVKESYIGVEDYEIVGTDPNQSSVSQGSSGTTTGSSNKIENGTYNNENGTQTNYDKAFYKTVNTDNSFTVTLQNGSTVNDISKIDAQNHYVDTTNGYVVKNENYTANIIMSGNNTVAGIVVLDAQDSIKLNGTGIVFGDTVDAGDIIVNSNGASATFENRVTVENGLKYEQDGTVNLEGGLKGDVIGSNSIGTLNLSGNSAQDIQGDIGTIGSLNISTGKNATITGDINATNTDIRTSSTLNISDGKTITSTIKSSDKTGNLTLLESGTINGTVGDITNSLNSVNTGATGSDSTFKNSVYSNTINSTGKGRTEFQGTVNTENLNVNSGNMIFNNSLNATSTNIGSGISDFNTVTGTTTTDINFSGNGTANLNNGLIGNIDFTGNGAEVNVLNGDITGSITGTSAGTLNMKGSGNQTISEHIDNINNFNINSGTTTANGNITASNINLSTNTTLNAQANIVGNTVLANSSILNSSGNITGNITGTSGTLNIAGTNNQNIVGDIGNIDNLNINSGKTVLIDGNINSKNTNINSNSTLNLVDGKNIDSIISGASGTLNLLGSSTVSNKIESLKDLNINADSSNSTFKDTVNSTNINSTGTGSSIFEKAVNTDNLNVNSGNIILNANSNATNTTIGSGSLSLNGGADLSGTNIKFTADGNLNLSDGSNVSATITTDTNDNGKIDIAGNSTITGDIGTASNKISEININGTSGKSVDLTNNIYAETTTINGATANFNTVSGTTTTDINFTGTGTANLNNGLTGTIDFSDKNATVNVAGGNISGSIDGTAGTLNMTGNSNQTITGTVGTIDNLNIKNSGKEVTVTENINATNTDITIGSTLNISDGKTITSTIKSSDGSGNLTLLGSGTVNGTVGDSTNSLNSINTGLDGSTVDFNNNIYSTNTNITGNGTVNLNGNLTGTNLNFQSNGTVNSLKDINANIVGNSGTLNMTGNSNQTITGTVGNIDNLNIKNSGKEVTVTENINATNTNITTGSTLNISDGKTITSTIKSSDGSGNLTLLGSSTVSNKIESLKDLNINADSSNSTFKDTVNSTNINSTGTGSSIFEKAVNTDNLNVNSGNIILNANSNATNTTIGSGSLSLNGGADLSGTNIKFTADGNLNLSDGSNVSATITTDTNDNGKIDIAGNSTITGDIGTSTDKISEININGASGKTVNLKDNVYSETTKIYEATVNFNQNSGDTNTNLVFTGDGTANLYANLTGSIDFNESNATVNVSHDKSIIGSVNSNSNSGVINFKGAGNIGESIDVNDTGNIVLGTLNVNTTNKDEDGNILPSQELYIHRDVYADRINLQNNATLVLKDGVNLTDTDVASSVLLTTDANGTGKVVFQGTSIVEGQIGEQSSNLDKIVVEGASGKTVEFKNEIFTNSLEYAGASEIVLNETLNGNVDFNNNAGTLSLADGLNLNTDDTRFIQESNATLNFKGESIVTGVLGGNTLGKTKFDTIKAGNDGKEVIFENKVYANNLEVNNGTVTLKDHLYSSLEFTDDGIVNIEDKKIIEGDITNNNYAEGTLNFKGEAIINKDIADASNILKAVNIATEITRDIVQDLEHNIYAKDTTIGNITNNNNIELNFNRDDITFGGNLTVNKNAKLNILDKKVNVSDKLALNDNSVLSYKILDNSAGIIFADSLDMRDNAQFEIDYNYSNSSFLKDEYTLVSTQDGIKINGVEDNNYKIYEKDGMIKDNSIIDSIIEINNKNLVLKADRTSAGEHKAEDLYIVKSGIGNDYSNGASQSLAGYANGNNREGALGDIIRDLEYIEDGLTITAEKQAQMIEIQRKLAPKANNATVQSAMNVSKVSNEMVSSRIADIRRGIFEDRFEYAVDNSPTFTGYSSGDDYYYDVGDSTLWIKASYTKATQDAVKSYDGYKTKSYGATAGIDKIVGDDVIFGISASYFDTNVTQSRGNDTTKSYRGTIYGSSEFGLAYVDANVSFAHHETDSSREANSGNLSSKIKAQELSARVETGLNLPIDDGSYITPYVAAQHTIYKQKAYQEKGTKYQNDALKVDAVELNTTSAEVGAKLTGRIELENALIIPHLSASITNNFNQKNKDVKAQFVGGGTKFSTPHQDLHKTIYSVGTGFEARITNNSSIILDATYDRSKDGKYRAYGANISFGYSF